VAPGRAESRLLVGSDTWWAVVVAVARREEEAEEGLHPRESQVATSRNWHPTVGIGSRLRLMLSVAGSGTELGDRRRMRRERTATQGPEKQWTVWS
jgi:hypothetical protein